MLAQYYHILKDLVAFQTISPLASSAWEMDNAVKYLQTLLQEHTFAVDIISGYGNPIVLASYHHDVSLPTCLVYGHYDVQMAVKDDGWKYDPFSLHLGKDKIYGRGVADNKWQFLIHLVNIFSLIEEKRLAYNIIIVLEWDEEIWSPHFHRFLLDHRDRLKSDFCLLSDSTVLGDTPCLDAGYRWGLNLSLHITTAKVALHSWVYGGITPNATHELALLLSKLYDNQHRITLPYFYYDVEEIPVEVSLKHKKIWFNEDAFFEMTGVKTIMKEKEFDVFSQIWLRPTIQVTGISGWYTGDGFQNAIPSTASAHINFRLVQQQTIKKVLQSFEQWLRDVVPSYVTYQYILADVVNPVKVDLSHPIIKKAQSILETITQKQVIYKYAWGSLPIVDFLDKEFHVPMILLPLVNEDCNAYGVNENFDIALIERGMNFSYQFFAR